MLKTLKSWKLASVVGILVLILGLGLRLYNLTIWPVFADEAIYIRWSQIMHSEPTLRFLPLSDGKQPLFMWILMFIVERFQDPLFAGRFVSVLSGLGTIIGVFVLSYIIFRSKKVSLVSGIFWAISPFSLFFDRMALVDSMLTMYGVWTAVFAILTAKALRLDFAMLTGFFLGFALLTKSPALFFAILLPTIVIFLNKLELVLVLVLKLFLLLLVTYFLSLVMYNILRLGPNFHLIGMRNQDYIFPVSHIWTNPKDPFIFHIIEIINWFWILGPSVLVILFVLGILFNLKKYKREIGLLLAWGIFPLLIQAEFAKVFTARYILFSIPFVYIVAASLFLVKKDIFAKVFNFGLLAFLLVTFFLDRKILVSPESALLPANERSGYLEEWTAGTGIREVADYFKLKAKSLPVARAGQKSKIVIGTEGYFGTLPDGLQMYLEGIPDITVIGVGLDIKEVPESLLESKRAGNKTYLIINDSRFKGDANELGLKLIAAYPKAFRREDTREYILHGPRESLLFFEL